MFLFMFRKKSWNRKKKQLFPKIVHNLKNISESVNQSNYQTESSIF